MKFPPVVCLFGNAFEEFAFCAYLREQGETAFVSYVYFAEQFVAVVLCPWCCEVFDVGVGKAYSSCECSAGELRSVQFRKTQSGKRIVAVWFIAKSLEKG